MEIQGEYIVGGLCFHTYLDSDIKRLSVKEIRSPKSFDNFGHAIPSGLYDNGLGPCDSDDVCGTCNQTLVYCPGHLGHIVLPVPIYNPMLFKLLVEILKSTCFQCHRILVNNISILTFVCEMRLLSAGIIPDEVGLMEIVCEQSKLTTDWDTLSLCLFSIVDKIIKGNIGFVKKTVNTTRHLLECQQHARLDFKKKNLAKTIKVCFHCKAKVRPLKVEHNSKLMFKGLHKSAGGKKDDKKKEKGVAKEATENAGKASIDIQYLPPTEILEHMRSVWETSREYLISNYGIFSELTKRTKQPTDIFFHYILPVTPPRFRPLRFTGGRKFEHMQSVMFSKILLDCFIIQHLLRAVQEEEEKKEAVIPVIEGVNIDKIPGKTSKVKLYHS